MADQDSEWRRLCQQAAQEHDPDKFLELIVALNKALDERERRRNGVLHRESNRKPRSSAATVAASIWDWNERKQPQLDVAAQEPEELWS